jgi:hypothetical protein
VPERPLHLRLARALQHEHDPRDRRRTGSGTGRRSRRGPGLRRLEPLEHELRVRRWLGRLDQLIRRLDQLLRRQLLQQQLVVDRKLLVLDVVVELVLLKFFSVPGTESSSSE